MKKIVLIIVAAFLLVSCNREEKRATQTLKEFEAFVEINNLDVFQHQIDSKGYSLYGHYTFEFINSLKGKMLKITQWRNVAGLMGPEFEFVYFYQGEPSFEEVDIISHSKEWERYQSYRTAPFGERSSGKVLTKKERKEFFEELTLHLNAIMAAHEDKENFSFEMIPPPQVQPNPLLEELLWEDQEPVWEGMFEASGQ